MLRSFLERVWGEDDEEDDDEDDPELLINDPKSFLLSFESLDLLLTFWFSDISSIL